MHPTRSAALLRGRAALLLAVLALAGPVRAQTAPSPLAHLDGMEPGLWRAVGFSLLRSATVEVRADVLTPGPGADPLSRTWILDARDRHLAWSQEGAPRAPGDEPGLQRIQERVELPAGDYEFYLSVAPAQEFSLSPRSLGDALGRLLKGEDATRKRIEALKDAAHRITATLEAPAGAAGPGFEPGRGPQGALIRLAPVGDGEVRQARFRLDRPQEVELYALIELPGGLRDPTDTAWIESDGRRLLELDRFNTRPAGGGEKNRVHRGVLELPAGDYTLFYGTDDAHAFGDFNVQPPDDPYGWGVCLLPGPDFEPDAFHLLADQDPDEAPALVLLRADGDDLFLQQCFVVEEAGTVQVRALGEEGSGGFVDQGWIVDLDAARVVWRMKPRHCVHAGGRATNRRCEEELVLPPGRYGAYYVTDGSHSPAGWTGGAPFRPEQWGLRIAVIDARASLLDDAPALDRDPDVLACLIRQGDDAQARQTFLLDEAATVGVLCVGEASGDEVYDGAWLVDEDGKEWWRARPGEGFAAGGSSKNRRWEARLELPPGRYTVHWRSDDSHSYPRFNSLPPWLPQRWGVTVVRVR